MTICKRLALPTSFSTAGYDQLHLRLLRALGLDDRCAGQTSQTDPLGHTTSYTYDGVGNVLTVTRPDGGVTYNTYDSMHQLISTTDPKGETTTMTYDLAGNLLTTTDAKGNTYSYTYDLNNRRTSLTYPDGSKESYGYDAVGNMVSYTTRAGQVKTSVFDNRNREVSYTWSDGTPGVTRSYDVAGRLLTSDNGVSKSIYTYDNDNRLTSETQTNATLGTPWTINYFYDVDGNRTATGYPSGAVVYYNYTNRNQVQQIFASGYANATYSYDANGNVLSKSLDNGTLASYSYDAVNRLTTLNHTLSGTSFARFDYGYDNVNRRKYEQRDSALGDVYSYDAVDQVGGVQYNATNPNTVTPTSPDRTVGYTYDAVGNRTSVADSTSGTTSYSPNNLNQYSSVGGASYGYDDNGNLVTGNGLYFYDAQNRLDYAQVGSNIDQMSYDSRNRCVQRVVNGVTTYLVYDGWNLIEERDSSGALLATYIHGVRQDELLTKTTTAGTVYYHENGMNSVTDLTDATGTVVEKYKYDAYGKPAIFDGSGSSLSTSAYGNRFLFTGREYLAEVNLYDYRARIYSADLGRFLQTDQLRFSAGDVNIYRYCGNNPINGLDSTGMCQDHNQSWWSAFWQGFSDANAWQQSAAATIDGMETFGGLAPWSGSFAIDPGNEYNQNISLGLGGVADLGVAGAAASFLGLGGAAVDASAAGNEAFWFGAGAEDAALADGANTLQLSSAATEALASGDASLMQAESAAFAASASGDVSVYVGAAADNFSVGNTFWNYELPQLLNNPAVNSITYIFPK